jgi:hypothetical protein
LQRYPTEAESRRFIAFVEDYRTSWLTLHGTTTENQVVASLDGDANSKAEPASVANNAAAPEDTRDVEFQLDALAGAHPPSNADEAAWASLVQSVFASAEFRYVR